MTIGTKREERKTAVNVLRMNARLVRRSLCRRPVGWEVFLVVLRHFDRNILCFIVDTWLSWDFGGDVTSILTRWEASGQ